MMYTYHVQENTKFLPAVLIWTWYGQVQREEQAGRSEWPYPEHPEIRKCLM